jgi:Holliday junction resolvase RusA-like endonuclease
MTDTKLAEQISELANRFHSDDVESVKQSILASAQHLGLGFKDVQRAVAFMDDMVATNSMSSVEFTILGDPPISKRPRSARLKNAAGDVVGMRVYAADGDDQLNIKDSVALQLPRDHVPYAGEVELEITIYRPMLASWAPYKRMLCELGVIRPESKPDYDNFSKIITDAMRGIVFVDDGQVVVGNVSLYYSVRPRMVLNVAGRPRRMNK